MVVKKAEIVGVVTVHVPIINHNSQTHIEMNFPPGAIPTCEELKVLIADIDSKLEKDEFPSHTGGGFRVVPMELFQSSLDFINKARETVTGPEKFFIDTLGGLEQ